MGGEQGEREDNEEEAVGERRRANNTTGIGDFPAWGNW